LATRERCSTFRDVLAGVTGSYEKEKRLGCGVNECP
jgi:hypothetical protein